MWLFRADSEAGCRDADRDAARLHTPFLFSAANDAKNPSSLRIHRPIRRRPQLGSSILPRLVPISLSPWVILIAAIFCRSFFFARRMLSITLFALRPCALFTLVWAYPAYKLRLWWNALFSTDCLNRLRLCRLIFARSALDVSSSARTGV